MHPITAADILKTSRFRSPKPSEDTGRSNHGVQKHQRSASAGAGRAWTEEEEVYLVRSRMHKMPYKHIALHLRKTELACRLHYHQMLYGSNRRRRSESISSIVSSCTTTYTPEEQPQDKEPLVPSPPRTPPTESCSGPSSAAASPQCSRLHVPILPKPVTQMNSTHTANYPYDKKLRLDTSFADNSQYNQLQVDLGRLRSLYDAYRHSFWSLIASEYSKDPELSGPRLEEAFFHSALAPSPDRLLPMPTPRCSPKSMTPTIHEELPEAAQLPPAAPAGFRAINESGQKRRSSSTSSNASQRIEKCAVASLLTVEKEVWAPKEIVSR
ncbi:hypothetical protein D8B26_003912 [Coccidioides posadasii str. Silveira]|uniref:Uncharacterized protein n=3 Tax=Coccidioides posadasii TaxID=199306 RepID=E9D9C9_COCPS|nr:hypothetical protein CPC735_072130 [Coccidioides posadasii C735 delta SOWgp]EER29531.1 hypothetical protein CPC735_072130 [Coccidioides posadasii C735 delta SOWgp]EFW17163.1 conserved hypothetical protein [Coccidioides posadasii str. Silveira]KMM70075.1 hypothetical protein CPAG_06387 [Coccidioides posadasii RMSCC 3488]QVM09248.1 hypothetical protein D8B26_003912 [Coccidioides posadasii str. Silveira]|eukprot:XP_003071676.1 hypothetical protein CPC735_072130 [Coccidioides posadasii C735 delta SOWgp]